MPCRTMGQKECLQQCKGSALRWSSKSTRTASVRLARPRSKMLARGRRLASSSAFRMTTARCTSPTFASPLHAALCLPGGSDQPHCACLPTLVVCRVIHEEDGNLTASAALKRECACGRRNEAKPGRQITLSRVLQQRRSMGTLQYRRLFVCRDKRVGRVQRAAYEST